MGSPLCSPFPRISQLCLALVLLAAAASVAGGQERPSVAYVVPAAIRAGHAQEITLLGRSLQDVTGLLADIRLDARLVKRGADKVTFRVTAPRDAWLGLHQVRAVTKAVVSAPRLVVVDELPLISQQPGNHSPDRAQAIALPTTIVGQTARG